MSPEATEVSISCHCAAARQPVVLRFPDSNANSRSLGIDLCHCSTCRHNSGMLYTSYAPIQAPPSLTNLVEYTEGGPAEPRRFFCDTCGSHVFRHERSSSGEKGDNGSWAVATGVITGPAGPRADNEEEEPPLLRIARHVNTASTRDGGLSPFIPIDSAEGRSAYEHSSPGEEGTENFKNDDALQAHCHCKGIRFYITRPDSSSTLPHSGFPDLTVPYATASQDAISNPRDEKWWLCPHGDPNPTKYLAGTCACRSCRLTSGFEIQSWAFVPRSNIFFLPSSSSPSSTSPGDDAIPLDFNTLEHNGVNLKSYASSPGVLRDFCPRCGATVFWHDRWRPDLIDVSAGLLNAPEGARAEGWLEWWCERVSFMEDAANGRVGAAAGWEMKLVSDLAEGLRREKNKGLKVVTQDSSF
ncbi:hypothetical protein M426DRAFT_318054 [Hypoxylon sp. CI-4A]|nr:hypothetical protein M426DRAFT_318054 [Hypoxylon sp. CI-4A]